MYISKVMMMSVFLALYTFFSSVFPESSHNRSTNIHKTLMYAFLYVVVCVCMWVCVPYWGSNPWTQQSVSQTNSIIFSFLNSADTYKMQHRKYCRKLSTKNTYPVETFIKVVTLLGSTNRGKFIKVT